MIRCWFLLQRTRLICGTTVPSPCLWKSSCWEGTALMKPHFNTFLFRSRYELFLDWTNQTKNECNWSVWSVNHYSFWIPQVGDASVGWALGYMLVLSNLLPAEVPAKNKCLKLEVWGILLFTLVFMLVAALLFTVIQVCFLKENRETSLTQISGPLWAQQCVWELVNSS